MAYGCALFLRKECDMAYVEPNGVIQIFKGINLDNRYMHTIYFASEAEQNTWFTGKLTNNGRQFTKQYYTRQNGGIVRLKVNSDEILDYTYMRFQNKATGTTDAHSTKWFYAFITSINYVNEGVTEITFEIDVMQTWFIPNGTLLPCYIERQHTTNDTFGLNLEAEPVGSDCYDFTEINVDNVDTDFGSYEVIINTTQEPDVNTMVRDGIVNGTYYDYIQAETSAMGTLKNKMIQALGSWDKNEQSAEIVDLFMFPRAFTYGAAGQMHSTAYHVKHNGKFDQYTPKNKKLFSYPYSALYVTTNDGDNATYKWEYFDGDITSDPTGAQFDVNATLTGGGFIEMHPANYNGILNNYDGKIIMNNFPKCSWNYDAYQAWIASGGQYKANYDLNMIQKKGAWAIAESGLSAVSSIAGQGASAVANSERKKPTNYGTYGINALSSFGQGVASVEKTYLSYTEARDKVSFEFKDARYQPNIIVGQQVPNLAVGYGFLKFRFFKLHVRDDEAKRIDDFFSVFGYAVNKVESPNLHNRQYWNFIKTKNSEIDGNMPASSKAAIANIFDGGIFFWNKNATIGDFKAHMSDGSIDNPIV